MASYRIQNFHEYPAHFSDDVTPSAVEMGVHLIARRSVITNARLPAGESEAILAAALGREIKLGEYPPYFEEAFGATHGVRFIFDRDGEFIEEVNEWQLIKARQTYSFASRMTRSSALMAILRWYEANDLHWQHCNELAHISLCRLHYRGNQKGTARAEPLVAKRTWNQWMVHWCQFLSHAERKGWVDDVGFDLADAKERGKSDPLIPVLLPSDMQLLDASAKSQRFRAGLHSLVGTGIRIGELADLRRTAVPEPDEFRGESYRPRTVIGKGLKEREILWPLRAAKSVAFYCKYERALAVEQLRGRVLAGKIPIEATYLQWDASAPQDQANLIESPDAPLWLAENGAPLSPKRWSKDFKLLPQINGRQPTPHWMRHTFAVVALSMLIKQQIKEEVLATMLGSTRRFEYFRDPLDEIRKRLGHASIETTKIYLDHVAEHRHLLDLAIADLQNMYLPS